MCALIITCWVKCENSAAKNLVRTPSGNWPFHCSNRSGFHFDVSFLLMLSFSFLLFRCVRRVNFLPVTFSEMRVSYLFVHFLLLCPTWSTVIISDSKLPYNYNLKKSKKIILLECPVRIKNLNAIWVNSWCILQTY